MLVSVARFCTCFLFNRKWASFAASKKVNVQCAINIARTQQFQTEKNFPTAQIKLEPRNINCQLRIAHCTRLELLQCSRCHKIYHLKLTFQLICRYHSGAELRLNPTTGVRIWTQADYTY